jgi:hypothetical protein
MADSEKGLPPLPEPVDSTSKQETTTSSDSGPKPKPEHTGLSFSSSKYGSKATAGKRKAVGDASESKDEKKPAKKKAKKNAKTLLSFSDDA